MSLIGLTDSIVQSAAFQQLVTELAHNARGAAPEGGARLSLELPRAGRPFVAAALYRTLKRSLIYVTASVDASRQLAGVLSQLTDVEALRFSEPNTAFYDTVAPVREVIAQRSAVLAALSTPANSLIIASPRALMHPMQSRAAFQARARSVVLDQPVALEQSLQHWVGIGYENEQVVERPGAFSRRGGIVDVWPAGSAQPVRIELFGNVADSIRYFDPGTQRSGQALKRVTILPLDIPPAERGVSLLDYLDASALFVVDDEIELQAAWEALEDKAKRERDTLAQSADSDEPADTEQTTVASRTLDRGLPYIAWPDFIRAARALAPLVLGQSLDTQARGATSTIHAVAYLFKQAPHFAGQLTTAQDYLAAHATSSVVVVSRQAARMAEVWSENQSALAPQQGLETPPAPGITFVVGSLPNGFVLEASQSITVLSDAEIFGHVKPESFARGRARASAPEKAFADWRPGDAVVHEDYGVGLFRGLVRLTVNTGTPSTAAASGAEAEREYLLLEYADADRLYVPLHQLDRVQRYVGDEADKPRLDKLHSGEWEKHKSRARGAAAEIARDMLRLYAAREVAKGHAFSRDGAWQSELESSFPFVETEDQLKAIDAVKLDMERPTPMDRLVVGDVGYGKTEVALRAAFKAVQDGKQVAVLVPTTVLAQQHWNTFSKRLASFPLKIEMHSRFRSSAEKKVILEKLEKGQIDIIIGTHGLVSDKVKFNDLGLLVIDEEHRFGVTAKEKLKKLRTEVDVLTLSATPIPRTLYLGLSGVRAISKIETPPAERLPIISYVGAWDDTVVQQAIRRELDRDGQIFIVHNRIQSIDLISQKLRRLVPEASMAVAHGQMDERELARIMTRFADGEVDVLLSTNIIESGLDIPNANTIIIDNADHFGLAELHQLRGRVGRSTIQAYAYFLHDRRARMTQEARERLETLRETGGVGAGYSISMRDLEMRGAGDMLGAKQSGHIASVGFDLYTRLLAHEVNVLRAMRDGTPMPPPEARPVVIDLPLTVGLPENYINDEPLRVQLYRRVASLENDAQVVAFEEELEDRFGKLPAPALNLTYQVRLKLAAIELGASSITTEGNRFTVRADPLERLAPQTRALQRLLGADALIGRKQVSFLRQGTPEQWKARLIDTVSKLAAMVSALPPMPAPRPQVAFEVDDLSGAPAAAKPMARDDDW